MQSAIKKIGKGKPLAVEISLTSIDPMRQRYLVTALEIPDPQGRYSCNLAQSRHKNEMGWKMRATNCATRTAESGSV